MKPIVVVLLETLFHASVSLLLMYITLEFLGMTQAFMYAVMGAYVMTVFLYYSNEEN